MVELRIRLPDGQVKRVTSVEFLFLIVLNLQIVSNWLEVLTSLCSVMNFRRFRSMRGSLVTSKFQILSSFALGQMYVPRCLLQKHVSH